MKDHEISAVVKELTKIAQDYHATQQLRERISGCVVPAIRKAYNDGYDSGKSDTYEGGV